MVSGKLCTAQLILLLMERVKHPVSGTQSSTEWGALLPTPGAQCSTLNTSVSALSTLFLPKQPSLFLSHFLQYFPAVHGDGFLQKLFSWPHLTCVLVPCTPRSWSCAICITKTLAIIITVCRIKFSWFFCLWICPWEKNRFVLWPQRIWKLFAHVSECPKVKAETWIK